jgi:hypothetical protein
MKQNEVAHLLNLSMIFFHIAFKMVSVRKCKDIRLLITCGNLVNQITSQSEWYFLGHLRLSFYSSDAKK